MKQSPSPFCLFTRIDMPHLLRRITAALMLAKSAPLLTFAKKVEHAAKMKCRSDMQLLFGVDLCQV